MRGIGWGEGVEVRGEGIVVIMRKKTTLMR